ncbi:hypothetical protein Ani05nite_24450 [Amorphoplanes nipponensis]|uniref:DUF4097 domain-containing protein n=1 Tax=Actinoplanes nipponensis TaxID=135950 RepID=A0A919JED1_9ACTN|nr:DUF4097 family beta strand repeat-containing protein [Actinoplanes nipponensis]GIE48911.1 hypothetical protein Ani05nite_24450 [Actinoplanes nipponensis]
MPTFDTPAPIRATVEMLVGDLRVAASDRTDTVVEVRPTDPGAPLDVRAAELTRVELTGGELLVKTPKTLKTLGILRKTGSIDVEISLPTGSQVRGEAAVAAFHCTGALGDVRLRTATGNVEVEHAATLSVTTAGGAIVAQSVAGDAHATTATGTIRIGTAGGTVTLKNSNGDSRVGTAGGDLRAKAANGDVVADHVHGDVDAASANGDIRIGAVHRGSVAVRTAAGELEVGIAPGTAAYLDLHTQFGKVLNHLEATGAPEPGEHNVQVRARTSFGDIIVRRGDAGAER